MVPRSLAAPALLLSLLFALTLAQENNSGALPLSAAEGVTDAQVATPVTTVLETLRKRGGFNVLVQLFEARGFSAELTRVSNRVTVLAPSDNAFANLARRLFRSDVVIDASDTSAIIGNLSAGLARLENVPALAQTDDILRFHQLGDAYTNEQLEDMGTVDTLADTTMTFVDGVIVDGETSGNATVSAGNIFNLNGWIHVVDRVLLPFDLPTQLDELDVIMSPTASPSVTPSPSVSATVTPSPGSSPSPSASVSMAPGTETDTETDTATGTETDVDGETLEESADASADAESGDDDESSDDDGVCFPAHATVRVASGATVRMDALRAEHVVRHSESGETSRIFLFTHRRAGGMHTFTRLTSACGPAVTLTASHYLYANGRLTRAGAVAVGDELRTVHGNCAVTSVERVRAPGLYAPHSVHGDLVVDDVVVSGYSTAVVPKVAEALLAPLRWAARAGVREPLGRALYDGADWALPLLPRGQDRY